MHTLDGCQYVAVALRWATAGDQGATGRWVRNGRVLAAGDRIAGIRRACVAVVAIDRGSPGAVARLTCIPERASVPIAARGAVCGGRGLAGRQRGCGVW